MISTVQSDIFKTNSASSSIKSAVETCNNVSKPDKDESTTVSGNNNAHSVIDDLISKNQSVLKQYELRAIIYKKLVRLLTKLT